MNTDLVLARHAYESLKDQFGPQLTQEIIQQAISGNKFLVIKATNRDNPDFKACSIKLLSTIEEVRKETKGWYYDNCVILNPDNLRGSMPLMAFNILSTAGVTRLYHGLEINGVSCKLIVDTGAPNSILFVNKTLLGEQISNMMECPRFKTELEPAYMKSNMHAQVSFPGSTEIRTIRTLIRVYSCTNYHNYQQKENGAVGVLGLDLLTLCDMALLSSGLLITPRVLI